MVAADAHHQHAVARLDPRSVARRADTRRHAAGHQAGEIERDVLINHDDRSLIDDGALGEGADHAEGADRDTVAIFPAVAAVELRSLRDARAFGAEMMQALPAPTTIAAAGDEGEHDVVASLDAADGGGADGFNHAGGLVAEHHRPHRHPPLAANHVIVGAAQADRGDAHQHLGGARRVERDALDRHRGADVAKQGGEGFHVS